MYLGKASVYTLGCKLNYAESSELGKRLEQGGYALTEFGTPADVVVINTCSVTENADKRCAKLVREAKRISAGCKVVIVGCYAQLKPEEISAISGVSLVLGAADKFKLVEHLAALGEHAPEVGTVIAGPIAESYHFSPSFSSGERTRSFLKVQDGCDYSCTFCTIPLARGASRSSTVEDAVAQARQIAALGYKEIVLTGINLGDFGLEYEGQERLRTGHFLDLMQALEEVEGIERYRISSIEPNLLTDEIIAHVAMSGKFVPHFHIPLQSGSDRVLGLMRRRYKREIFASRLAAIRQAMPDACIGADVIVGFPQEGDADFEATYSFLAEVAPSYLHVFTYSERANTQAAAMAGAVPKHVRAERSKRLHILSDKLKRAFYASQAGTMQEVLWESGNATEGMEGFCRNYIKVWRPYDGEMVGDTSTVSLTKPDEEALRFVDCDTQVRLISDLDLMLEN